MTRKMSDSGGNIDAGVVDGFGDEWSRFPQTAISPENLNKIFTDYFRIFPWDSLPDDGGIGADIGCGSGRWAAFVAPRVAKLYDIDPSPDALAVDKKNLRGFDNVCCRLGSADCLPFEDGSLDFAYSLGVLHHIPDTQAAIRDIASKLKPGAPFLVYLYYAFDNRPRWYRGIWKMTEILRRFVSVRAFPTRYVISQFLALAVYWPLSRVARILDRLNMLPGQWPLTYYRDKPLYVLRTDALDRFGTALEKRFTREHIQAMLEASGFSDIVVSDQPPYWCVCGIKNAK